MQKRSLTTVDFLTILLLMLVVLPAACEGNLLQYATRLEPLPPTPAGDGHIGRKSSGEWIQLRFRIPGECAGYWLSAAGIVAFTGKGSRYRLLLRKDSKDGPTIYTGPVVKDGNRWNAVNRESIEITAELTRADYERGYVDIFATARVEGDGWTVYKSGSGRGVSSLAVEWTPELRKQRQTRQVLKEHGISIIPIPDRIHLIDDSGPFELSAGTGIVYPAEASEAVEFAAKQLQQLIAERTGLRPEVTAAGGAAESSNCISLSIGDVDATRDTTEDTELQGSDSYNLQAAGDTGVDIIGGGEAGMFYGAMTAAQLLTTHNDEFIIRACNINDHPAFEYRIIQYDIARGQTVNIEYVKRLIRRMARLKINAILFYMENDFKFKKYPFLGREGTFTHEKARELSEYANRYHVQLIPQFESLGHASAVLRHPQLKDLREAGSSWVFCTSEPKTWEFLDNVYGELIEAFVHTEFIHVGGDEFENQFGKCERCRAKADEDGIGALYAEHVNKLRGLVEKHGRKMMLWPAHHGPSPELTRMTMQYHEMLPKDIILTEWIYHGPQRYPQINKYQQLGFEDVFCCPSVRATSSLWPDNPTALRGISGFYQAGEERDCGGAYCTTWGFMHGAIFENSMYPLAYSAECGWNPHTTSREEFNRRFGEVWFGMDDGNVAEKIDRTLFDPLSRAGEDTASRDWRHQITKLLWTEPGDVVRDWVLRRPELSAQADELLEVTGELIEAIDGLKKEAERNRLTLRAARLGFSMAHAAARKLAVYKQQAQEYRQATNLVDDNPQACGERIADMAKRFAGLADEMRKAAGEYDYFVENCGAYKRDPQRLRKQARQISELAEEMKKLASGVGSGELKQLPPPQKFGFMYGSYQKIGVWKPNQMSEEGTELRYDVTDLIDDSGEIVIEFEYTDGAHGLDIKSAQLLCDGDVVAEDGHNGWAGSGSHDNAYHVKLDEYDRAAKYEISADVASSGGTDSSGVVWMFSPGNS